jgi:AraC-like DNA-binding protein
MKNKQERIIHFELSNMKGISVTHGYNISNAFPVHFHTTYNLGIIELGEREFTYRGIKSVLKQNDIFIIQPFEPHSCKSFDHLSHSYKIISFTMDMSCYFPQLIINEPDLLSNIREFHNLAEYEKSSLQLVSLYEEIIMQLKACSLGHSSDILDEKISSGIYLAKQFIEKNCQFDTSLKEISDIACLSEFHFNRYFHKCYGLSPYAYYLICKIKKSQKVLVKQKSVVKTAYEIGFFDQSHYTRLFKKNIGVTPGKYLRDNKKFE